MVRRLIVLALVGLGAVRLGAQQVSKANVSRPSTPVEVEFAELNALLDAMPEDFGAFRGFCAPDPGSVLAARLALFPRRFGSDPHAAPEWKALSEHAQRVLDGAGDAGLPQTGECQDVSAQMDRYVLLDLLGRADEAQKILTGVSTKGADGCITCTAENSIVANQRRSEDAERRGELALALRFLHESMLDTAALDWNPDMVVAGEDLFRVRYGLLLARTGHADVGITVLQDLARARADTLGGRLALAQLQDWRAVAKLPMARCLVGQVYAGQAYQSCAVVATWTTDDPTSMRWIAVRFPGQLDAEWTRTVTFDPEAFETVRPALEKDLTGKLLAHSIDALALLHGLSGGAERYVGPFLEAVASFKETDPALVHRVDDDLRWMHGGGPELSVNPGSCDWASLSSDWRRWRQSTGTHARSAR